MNTFSHQQPLILKSATAMLAAVVLFAIAPTGAHADEWSSFPTDQRVLRSPVGEQQHAARMKALEPKSHASSDSSAYVSAPLPTDQRISLTPSEERKLAALSERQAREEAARAAEPAPMMITAIGPLPTDQRVF